MENIPLPTKIEHKESDSPNVGTLIIEPLFPGYGTTIGNTLRRVLLSSLPGAAVTAIKIIGVSHEFTTIPKVGEDVLQIILNLKQLRLKVFSDEPVKLYLKIKGKKTVTAADFDANSDVEITNTNLTIASLTGKDAELEMEVWVQQGRGYESTEARKVEKVDIGVIQIDSYFSPVRRVAVNVEGARVGQMTNFDKLTMEIETDGTFTCEEVIKEATKILVDHFFLIGKLEGIASEEEEEITENEEAEISAEDIVKDTDEENAATIQVKKD